ncbi:MAG: hypothetical protein HY812_08785 [Planctomycetes bacterium]|nr:hypothetical protein [Planctomycetota bacterium]
MLRLKVRTIRASLWAGNILVFLGIAFLVMQIVRENRPGRNPYLPGDTISKAINVQADIETRDRAGGQSWENLKSCWELNVTGKEPPPEEVEGGAEAAAPALQPIEEVLKVRMVVACGGQASYATISYPEDERLPKEARPDSTPAGESTTGRHKSQKAETLVRAGDELRPPYNAVPFLGKVKEIQAAGVVFSWGGTDITLGTPQLPRTTVGTARKMDDLSGDDPAAEAAREELREQMRQSRQVHEHSWFIGTEERDRVAAEYETMLEQIGIGADWHESEQRMLMKLTKIPEDSLAAARGFQVGDVVHSINGERISSKNAAVQYFRQHADVSTFNVEIERRGTRITKTFQIAR